MRVQSDHCLAEYNCHTAELKTCKEKPVADSRFVYVTYIRTTTEKLWRALIEPEFTKQFWCATWQDCQLVWEGGTQRTAATQYDVGIAARI